jgi:16S rRNA (uracil1498-N3)-methyltransferase
MFYVDSVRAGRAEVSGDTAEHLRKVLRVERGQRYEISDNERLYLAEVADFGKKTVEFEIVEALEARRPPVRLRLYAALIKFDHFEWMLEKATELGVERITPLSTIRTERGLEQAAAKRRERWHRIVYESGQQCRRVTRPEIDRPYQVGEALKDTADLRVWLDESEAAPILGGLPEHKRPEQLVAICVGPEGGWDDRERQGSRDAGWLAASLGSQVLRAETAAIAGLAVVNAAWGMA